MKLFKTDSKKKLRVVELYLNNNTTNYTITGNSGLYSGKRVDRPIITISKGKSTRTLKEQSELQFNSIINSFLDKGYKSLDSLGLLESSGESEILSKFSTSQTDSKGRVKPMLALSFPSKFTFIPDYYYASAKLDGVRCTMFYKDNQVQTSSRGGKDYNNTINHIINNIEVINFFKNNPNIILDGELYIHGKPLSYISSLVRSSKKIKPECSNLEFHVYDLVDETKSFTNRLNLLKQIKINFNKIIIVEHKLLEDESEIKSLHDEYVKNGYEGAILRVADDVYKTGGRDKRMLKVKLFEDDEFKILDLVDGLRDEDLCFLMETKEGNQFKAKPMGDRELKQWYRDNINSIKNTFGTVKYFGYTTTNTPVPNLPVFKSLRNYE